MVRKKMWLVGLVLGACCVPAVLRAETAFKDMSFEEAQKAAAEKNKLIFIDFYTTWCGPCKMMDASTFKDEKVIKYLNENTIPLKIDAEREVKLAARYEIEFYPTLLFVKPDGTEFERLLGYMSAEELLEVGRDLAKGVTILDRARQKVEASPNDPEAHLKYAQALANKGKHEDALKEYLWTIDNGAEKDPQFAAIRDGLVVMELAQLAATNETAAEELTRRRNAAEERILEGEPRSGDVALYAAVNMGLDEPDRTLGTLDSLMAKNASKAVLESMLSHVLPLLLESERYEDIARSVNIPEKVDEILASVKGSMPEGLPEVSEEQRAEIAQMQKLGAAHEAAAYYQVLLALGRTDEARKAGEKILALDDSAEVYNMLAWAGYLSGKPNEDHLEQARRAYKLSNEESAAILDTLARIMFALGQKDQAIELCEKGLAKAESDFDKYILGECLADFRTGRAAGDGKGS